ncbi:MAG: hypothetical protein HY560_01705 [Gemmatimonadetes bacterium]|nr:hypothetical protein [Gemmatimonadota bacterium]
MRSPTLETLLRTVVALTAGCGPACSNRVVQSSASPESGRHAVVFERVCPQAGLRQLHVSIIPSRSAEPTGEGNALIVEPTGSAAEPRVALEWIGRDRLKVSYSAGVRVLKSVRSTAAVRIEYVPIVENGSTMPIGL